MNKKVIAYNQTRSTSLQSPNIYTESMYKQFGFGNSKERAQLKKALLAMPLNSSIIIRDKDTRNNTVIIQSLRFIMAGLAIKLFKDVSEDAKLDNRYNAIFFTLLFLATSNATQWGSHNHSFLVTRLDDDNFIVLDPSVNKSRRPVSDYSSDIQKALAETGKNVFVSGSQIQSKNNTDCEDISKKAYKLFKRLNIDSPDRCAVRINETPFHQSSVQDKSKALVLLLNIFNQSPSRIGFPHLWQPQAKRPDAIPVKSFNMTLTRAYESRSQKEENTIFNGKDAVHHVTFARGYIEHHYPDMHEKLNTHIQQHKIAIQKAKKQ